MRIYIESTIPSYLVARPAQNVLQAARQKLTQDWWASKRATHDLYTSQIVLDEVAVGDPVMAKLRLKALENMPLLDLTSKRKMPRGKSLAQVSCQRPQTVTPRTSPSPVFTQWIY